MKPVKFLRALALILLTAGATASRGDDTDLFQVNPSVTAQRPNVLIIWDNTANWGATVDTSTAYAIEKSALQTVVNGLTDQFNVGLMLFNSDSGLKGAYVRSAIRQMTSANKTAFTTLVNGLVQSGSGSDKGNNAQYANSMHEAYLYFGSKAAYLGGSASQRDLAAFSSGTTYQSPISDACQKNFIIFISNGSVDSGENTGAQTLLQNDGGYISSDPITLNPNGEQSSWADEFARFVYNTDISTAYSGTQNIVTYALNVYKSGTDTQTPVAAHIALMKSMANQGHGKYFPATNSAAVVDALNKIFEEVQAINSVYSSSTLPVSVNVRGTYLNQVYMGVFRPDANSSPRWTGNLKQYKLAVDTATNTLFLADKTGTAAENASTGFVSPSAQSFWTTTSTFWNAAYYPSAQGAGGISDLPDGDLVEKGGAAQHLRTAYATSQTSRNLYTCTTGCTTNSLLSATPFSTSNADITQALLGAASSTERDNIINWIRGANNNGDDNPDTLTTSIRGYGHGDVLHSRPAVINYNRTAGDRDIVIYYGDNDAIFHAVKGGQDDADGYEKWGFVMPEHFGQLKRLRDASPLISSSNTKPYFADGPVGVYQLDSNNDGKLVAADGDKVDLFIGMRRGGRFYYALDVSDPDNPKFLWKKTNTDAGYGELGQTWSEPKVATIRYQTNPVLIFGLGYDATANDANPATTASMGRGIMIADAATGTPIWQAGPSPSGSTYTNTVASMTYSIPADMTVLDTDGDGKADRIYAADTGGNLWRINIDDANPSNWTVNKLASVGGTGINARKFLYPPDVVFANGYDAVLLGSGDREHPFDSTIQNRYYMFKDNHALNAVKSTITESSMYDATSNLIQVGTASQQATALSSLNSSDGWYLTLGTGEKVVGGSTTLGGTTYFATNKPVSTLSAGSCASNLGEARIYMLNYENAAAVIDTDYSGNLATNDRSRVREGGGYPPSPVPVVVDLGGKRYEAVITGTQVETPPSTTLEHRYRTYWYIETD